MHKSIAQGVDQQVTKLFLSFLTAIVTMNTQLHLTRLSSIPPPGSSTTIIQRNPLSIAINTHFLPDDPPGLVL